LLFSSLSGFSPFSSPDLVPCQNLQVVKD